MNQETLKEVLQHSADLMKKAEKQHKELFSRLSPDCKFYRLICLKLRLYNSGHNCICQIETCPLLVPNRSEDFDGLGHA